MWLFYRIFLLQWGFFCIIAANSSFYLKLFLKLALIIYKYSSTFPLSYLSTRKYILWLFSISLSTIFSILPSDVLTKSCCLFKYCFYLRILLRNLFCGDSGEVEPWGWFNSQWSLFLDGDCEVFLGKKSSGSHLLLTLTLMSFFLRELELLRYEFGSELFIYFILIRKDVFDTSKMGLIYRSHKLIYFKLFFLDLLKIWWINIWLIRSY